MHHSCQTLLILLSLIVFIHEISGYDKPDLSKYDPFKKSTDVQGKDKGPSCFGFGSDNSGKSTKSLKYKQKLLWHHFFFGNILTASVGHYYSKAIESANKNVEYSFEKKDACSRVIVFSVRGVVLDGSELLTDCKGENLMAGLIFIDNVLSYYPRMRIRHDPKNNQVVVVNKESGKKENGWKTLCVKKHYNMEGQSSYAKEDKEKSITVTIEGTTDEDCAALLLEETGALLFSSAPPKYRYTSPSSSWGINIQDTGFGIRFMEYNDKFCHVKLVVSYNQKPLTGTAMFCGASRDTVITEQGLYFGNIIVVRMSADSAVVTALHDPRNGECIKQEININPDQTREDSTSKRSMTMLHEPDQECKDFKDGKLTEQQLNREWITSLTKMLEEDKVEVVPYYIDALGKGPLQPNKVYNLKPKNIYASVNTGKDMGVFILSYRDKLYWVVLVAKGVVIDVALTVKLPNLTVVKDTIFFGNMLLFKKSEQDENLFTVVAKWDNNFCSRSRYVLLSKDGQHYREEVFPAYIAVSDDECTSLIAKGDKQSSSDPRFGLATIEQSMADLADYIP